MVRPRIETYTACDSDGDSVVDFLDACPTDSGADTDGCVPPVITPPVLTPPPAQAQAPATTKKKCKKKKKRAASVAEEEVQEEEALAGASGPA